MAEDTVVSKRSFSRRIDRSDWKQHLDSHRLLICDFKQFLEPFHLPLFADKFMGMLRSRCFEQAGLKSNIEELQISFQAPHDFRVKISFSNSKEQFSEEYSLTIADILAYPISSEPLLRTQRLEIGLLLPSDEPAIINFIKDPEVWKMRGERYSPLVNIHTDYQSNNLEFPWYRYYFVVRMCQSKEPIGFIGFYQISQPGLITPIISQTPYESVMLSYGLSKHYWGKELMSEALAACLPWFIANQKVHELVAFAEMNNQGSRRILQKLGLQEYGPLENAMISADLKDRYKFIIYKRINPSLEAME